MDAETPPASSKRGRKGRTSKSKQSADLISASAHLTEPPSSIVEPLGLSYSPASILENSNAIEDDSASTASCSSLKTNDNLLMPPPSQPDNLLNSPSEKVATKDEGPQDHECIVDAFSIFCFNSEDEVKVAVDATGNSYPNKRVDEMLNKGSVSSPRTPRLPSRDSNSPTGRRRGKSAQKVKELKTPKQSKRGLKKSPLIGNSSLIPATVPSAQSAGLANGCSMDGVIEQMTSSVGLGVKKEESENKYAVLKLSPEHKPPHLFKSEEIMSNNYKIKSESLKVASNPYQANESKSIKQENNDIKEDKRASVDASTTHLIQAPPLKPCKPTASKKELCSDERINTRLFENSHKLNSEQFQSSSFSQHEESAQTADLSGSEAAHYPASAAIPTLSTTSTATSVTTSTSTPPVVSRSNSVHSITSSNSRRTTPICAGSVGSRDRDNSSIRTTSRSSDRNTSRGSLQPTTSTTDLYSSPILPHTSFGQINPGMLSFGAANGLTPPFSYPPVGGFTQPPNFHFGADLLSPFSHNTSLPHTSEEALRAELSRRGLGNDRQGMPQYLRPDLLFSPGAAMNNSPMPPNIMLMQMLEKLPKVDPLQQLFYTQQRNVAVTSSAQAGLTASPVVGPSPFQSVPGGHHSASTSPLNAQKKSGKWCSAHVRIAYQIYHATKNHPRPGERLDGSKNGVVGSTSSSNNAEKAPVQPLSHSINSITSNIHRPKDIPASAQHPKPSPVTSPHVSSPLQRADNSKVNGSNPGSPASFLTNPSSVPKELSGSPSSGRSLPNGAMSVPSPRDLNWSKTTTSQPLPSTSSSAPPPSKKRVRDDRDMRKANGSSSAHGKRPSSTSYQHHAKKRRSRSRSPPKSSRSKYIAPRQSNGHTVEQDKPLTSSLPAANMQQMFAAQMLPLMHPDNKTLPSNGVPPTPQEMWASLMQRDMGSQRYLSQINPALAMALNERDRSEKERAAAMQLLERAKASNTLCNSGIPGLNGFHHANTLASLVPISSMGGPPPLISTSQTKANSHLSSHSQSTTTSNDAYHR